MNHKIELFKFQQEVLTDPARFKVMASGRRVGKSYLLFQLINLISERYDNANIVYINLEDLAFDFIKTAKDLNNYVIKHLSSSNPNYVFIDEIQDVIANVCQLMKNANWNRNSLASS